MRTLDEIRKERPVLFDVKTITDRFSQYAIEIGARFDALNVAISEVTVLLEQIEKNTRPTTVLPFPVHGHSVIPTHSHSAIPSSEMEK